jgi:Leucine-rich repeat (LRR) protein
MTLACLPAPILADDPPPNSQLVATVLGTTFSQPDPYLAHNIPDLRLTFGDQVVTCGFLTHYRATGDLVRWGFPTSEVLEERQGILTQYYQRGVVDCHQRAGAWRMERRLAWDYLGGGIGGSVDLGVEPHLRSEQPGVEAGPWGHRVSNFAIDGTPIGFLDFFTALGGVQAFGFPKSDARRDDDPRASLQIPGANPNFVRQYFQAAVLEFHPSTPQPVKLRLLGDDVRNLIYPDHSFQAFPSFNPAEPLTVGQTFRPHGLTERAILTALYQATDGPTWVNSENWLSDAPLNDWHGVTTAPDGRVVQLTLAHNRLRGELAVPLERLPHLQHLNLTGNSLQGPLPAGLGTLANLQTLQLGGNHLKGELPATLRNLHALTWLDLSANQLSGPVPDLRRLTRLTTLNLRDNQLGGRLPSTLGEHQHLAVIDLSANQFVGDVPASWGALPNLRELRVSRNFLNGCLAPALRRIPSHDLGELIERFCDQAPDPAHTTAASDRAALEAFYYATGGPAWNNSGFWLSSAPLQAWHGVWANPDGRVTHISLKNNNLRGVLPSMLGDLASLKTIEIRENKLRGVIPPGLGRAKELDWLNLSGNQMEGTIPDSLQGLTKFRRLSLDSNSFEGEIPAWLGNFPRLRDLHLRNNQFRGRIPASLGHIPALDNLILSNNQLEGEIPASLGNPSGLTSLVLSGNQLTGQIPPEIGRIGFLGVLQLDRNRLSGQIPPELGRIHNLSNLNLSGNNLHGEIPATFSGLTRMYRLRLGSNRLSGKIPAFLGNPVELRVLDLSHNQFSGTIPGNLGSASKLMELRLAGNRLTGGIPPELGRLFHLTDLTLGDNQLHGPIPPELGNLTQLTQLTLNQNQLQGDIPPALIRLLNLDVLSLSGNALTGCLPITWRDIRQHDLTVLGLPFCDQ